MARRQPQELLMPHIDMTREELRAARKALGLTQAEFAVCFDVDIRTVKAWEAGHHNDKPAPVPRLVAILARLALKHAPVRLALGIPSKENADKKKVDPPRRCD
jgi:DNA-binding transcriptional regulator YiaG